MPLIMNRTKLTSLHLMCYNNLTKYNDVNPRRNVLRFEGSKIDTSYKSLYHAHCIDVLIEIASFI